MTRKILYRFIRDEGGTTVSPNMPHGEYTVLSRLVADEGCVLTDGTHRYDCVDTDNESLWQEVEDC